MEYAVRGPLVIKAGEYDAQLQRGEKGSLPFDELVFCNIGNPQQVGQRPITFYRQVLSLLENPALLSLDPSTLQMPEDVFARARFYLKAMGGHGTGAYTHSQGIEAVREQVREFVEKRDGGVRADSKKIFLTNGASSGVKDWLSLVLRKPTDGVLIPIPQYPLYSATLAALGARALPYYLDEEQGWAFGSAELERAYGAALDDGGDVRALAVINPGNPTGQVLGEESMRDIVRFCAKRRVLLLADEVYQENVYGGRQFVSFKRVVADMIESGDIDHMQLISFHSTSKGFIGECGKRGGYFEAFGFDDETLAQVYKLASVSLCSNVTGQLTTGLMCAPPLPGEPSHELFERERTDILGTLERRAQIMVNALNGLEGVSCNEAEGAMYVFPRIELPAAAHDQAARLGIAADAYYASRLLDDTGILVVPGSGFGQKPGTLHFRSTFLPPLDRIERVADSLVQFHHKFLQDHK